MEGENGPVESPIDHPDFAVALFSRLWEELDFDDHPLHGGHSPEPEGKAALTVQPNRISVSDARARFYLYADINEALADHQDGVLHIEPDVEGRIASVHLLSDRPASIREGPGRLGLHRWTLTPSDLSRCGASEEISRVLPFASIDNSTMDTREADVLVSRPDLSAHPDLRPDLDVSVWRLLLESIRNALEMHLPDWTWHLEIDNKRDRTGWYVRAPAALNSLFTIFAGLGWHPDADPFEVRAHGFLLFERAPPGELDRPDEAVPNRADERRVERLCASNGPLAGLVSEPDWAERTEDGRSVPTTVLIPGLSGKMELWPPAMGRWPLMIARAKVGQPDLESWFRSLLSALGPSLAELSAID